MLVETGRKDKDVAAALQILLSDLHVVYTHLHNLHWNIEGPAFFEYHEHLQDGYEMIAEDIDDTAERLLMIGYRPLTNLRDYITNSSDSLENLPSEGYQVQDAIKHVISDTQQLIATVQKVMGEAQKVADEGTFDFGVDLLRKYEKNLWFWTAAQSK
jgi:starvation-inducible DNA-binding protein